jgi:glycosyltransferase involved in cell wall biosynthesis
MEILNDFAKLCPWADFHIVGGWPEDIGLWKARLERNNNVFFHGHVPPSRVPGFLRIFDVLIAPYQPVVGLHGGAGDNSKWVCPLKLFDYMAAGKPIICSNLPVIQEVVSHGRNALLCAPTDVTAWAEALHLLRDNPDFGAKIGADALETFERRYSWDARALSVLDGI